MNKQVFQTDSKRRWRIYLWTSRALILALILSIPVVVYTLSRDIRPDLPILFNKEAASSRLSNPVIPLSLNAKEAKKYKGFDAYFKMRQTLKKPPRPVTQERIRAAFYVDWDPQSFYSLNQNIDRVNTVVPEWFFIDPKTDSLKMDIDQPALKLMQAHHVRILPLINNINRAKGIGEFDGAMLHRILHDPSKRDALINQIIAALEANKLQGVNIDFEDFEEKSDEPIIQFQRELYTKLHQKGLMVTQDIMPNNEDFNISELSKFNDYLFLMAYDEHFSSSVPGPVSSQQWIEKELDEAAQHIPSDKLILCLAAYGYDWAQGDEAQTVTYQQALANARIYNSPIKFDNNTYNNSYTYKDGDSVLHQVYFTDAATNFNVIRFADQYGTAGTALWRLGSEDERVWTFYPRILTEDSLKTRPFDFTRLEQLRTQLEKPDYVGDGEILNVIAQPSSGKINLEIDSTEQLISEQRYQDLPTRYVIQKFGNVKKEVVLTFDDGPDPEYTPEVLDILKREHVPAAFFIVGLQAENNLPLLKRIYAEGHEIGNHSFTHPNIAEISPERAATEMEATRLLIESAIGHSTILFRAPYNADSEPSTYVELRPVALSREKNYYTVGESIDPNDWQPHVTADQVYQRVVHAYEANPNKGIILLHDAGGDRQATVDALPRIIHYFKSKGIAFTTISKLLNISKSAEMPAVSGNLISVNGGIASAGYWAGKIMNLLFWLAILMGLGRITVMGIMAIIGKLREKPAAPYTKEWPAVSIIVPAYNEELNAVRTVENLLRQDYPCFDIVFVDDGSKDETYERVYAAFNGHPKVRVLTKANGGKASALNYGIRETDSDFVICIDADTQLMPDAVSKLMTEMMNGGETVGAVAGNVKVGNDRTLLTKWQSIEYITAQNFDRRAFATINGITVVPGAIGAFRKEAIQQAGGFTTDTLAEDCDLTISILKAGYRVLNCNQAIAVTEAPETFRQFMKQRFRWSYGIMQAFWKHRHACFKRQYKGLGMVALPNVLIFQILLPMIAPLADLMLIISLIWNHNDSGSLDKIASYYLVFLLVDVLVSVLAFSFEKERFRNLIWLLPQRFVYRQLMYVILYRSIRKAIKGESQGWGALKRTGNVVMQA